MPPTIHGVPLSQPFRSVVWPCLIKGLEFRLEIATPGAGASGKYSTRRSEYLSRFPLGTVPSMEDTADDGSKICISEAPAILACLAAKNGWSDIYPIDISARAKVDEYLHWHHSNLRSVSRGFFRPRVFPHALLSEDVISVHKREALHALKVLERSYLRSNDGFLLGTSHPTAADFMAYEEIVQLQMCNLDSLDHNYPNIYAWTIRMRSLPFHNNVHAALEQLGDLNEDSTTSSDPPMMMERLALASKVGLKALKAGMQEQEAMPSAKL
eukprot:CAMPEP_0181048882 /NCGR_PEP_ID=MMETSP1070-20121207/15672_1 /TAXON_ID=265543 /ORGANISM="Minutocellus polymorphus, Strain NH13" /LENGTH=268 /DNA_ID=CAMNT_0023127695 /DNA_START=137 /DNA_END=943 /DNA_ORIENTATION=+